MPYEDAREKLVELLDRRVFQPVLRASADDYGPHERGRLKSVQRKTRDEQHRYREEYHSAEKVARMFHDDLSSEPAQKVDRDLRRLHLPVMADIQEEFEDLCDQLGVHKPG